MADQDYLGTQDQGSTAAEFNSRDYHIRQVIEQSVRTGGPVKVVRAPYDANGNALTPGTATPIGYVDVQPLVNQIDGYGQATPHGVVYRLTYFRYQNGLFAVYADPVVGDIGHMVVADRDVTSVYATNAQANPGSLRKFDMADGTYFGNSRATAPQSYLVPQVNGDVNIVVKGGSGNLNVIGNITATGNITAGQGSTNKTLLNHTHNQGNDSHGDSEVPTNPPNNNT